MTVWLVRAGRYGERETLALEKGLSVIGWEELPDLSAVDLAGSISRSSCGRPTPTPARAASPTGWASSGPFASRMQVGDLVVLPLKTQSAIAIGKVAGPYVYRDRSRRRRAPHAAGRSG